jgi:hypothetical protein
MIHLRRNSAQMPSKSDAQNAPGYKFVVRGTLALINNA